MQGSVFYNLGFAAVVCVVCAIFVSSSAIARSSGSECTAGHATQCPCRRRVGCQ